MIDRRYTSTVSGDTMTVMGHIDDARERVLDEACCEHDPKLDVLRCDGVADALAEFERVVLASIACEYQSDTWRGCWEEIAEPDYEPSNQAYPHRIPCRTCTARGADVEDD